MNTNFYVVDAVMGSGKTEAMMYRIFHESDKNQKWIVVARYLQEVNRYIRAEVGGESFKAPQQGKGGKLGDLKNLIKNNENIVTTHALFDDFDDEVIDLLEDEHYTLVIDEAPNVIQEYPKYNEDLDLVVRSRYILCDHETHRFYRNENFKNYKGYFKKLFEFADTGRLTIGNGKGYNAIPANRFTVFDSVYILTYMFDSSCCGYFFKFCGFEYEKLSVKYDGEAYKLIEYDPSLDDVSRFKDLITLCDDKSLNEIGDGWGDLSHTWYERNKYDEEIIKKLKANIRSYFMRTAGKKHDRCLWTVLSDYKDLICPRSYGGSYLEVTARATNEYAEKDVIIYMANRFLDTEIQDFFRSYGIKADNENYAISEMVQFIWRSAIRKGQPINLYMPSRRMRYLLEKWLNGEKVESISMKDGENYLAEQKAAEVDPPKPPRKPRGWTLDE